MAGSRPAGILLVHPDATEPISDRRWTLSISRPGGSRVLQCPGSPRQRSRLADQWSPPVPRSWHPTDPSVQSLFSDGHGLVARLSLTRRGIVRVAVPNGDKRDS